MISFSTHGSNPIRDISSCLFSSEMIYVIFANMDKQKKKIAFVIIATNSFDMFNVNELE
jgi:hypothetical protein